MIVKEKSQIPQQATQQDTVHDKSLKYKEKGQNTVHDTIQDTVHDERQVSLLTEDEPSREKGSVLNFQLFGQAGIGGITTEVTEDPEVLRGEDSRKDRQGTQRKGRGVTTDFADGRRLITEGGFSNPPFKGHGGLESPPSFSPRHSSLTTDD